MESSTFIWPVAMRKIFGSPSNFDAFPKEMSLRSQRVVDDLSRPFIETGGLAKLVDDSEIIGITIFVKAIGRNRDTKTSFGPRAARYRCR